MMEEEFVFKLYKHGCIKIWNCWRNFGTNIAAGGDQMGGQPTTYCSYSSVLISLTRVWEVKS